MAGYPLTNKLNAYARSVVSGKTPACLQVRQACQRHLDDLAASTKKGNTYPYRFDKNKSERILDFAQNLKHVKGKWAGQYFKLEPWQCFFMGVPFGWIRKDNGLRRFREIYAAIPRKNSKSTMGAIIGLYMFAMDDEQGAEIYSAATSEAQAFEVFRPAWQMTKKASDFREYFAISQGGSDKHPGNIYSMSSGSRFETVIGKPGDGSSPHAYLLDEFHEAKTEDSYDTGKTGMGARAQPMMVVITTAGTNTSYPCYALQKRCEKILSGELVNDELFALIYTIDKDDDWTATKTWKKANPNYGVSIYADFLESQRKTAIQDPRKQNIIKCKHLNMWSNAGDAWMNMVEWGKCYDPDIRLDQFHSQPVYLGLDLASKIDVAAKIYLFKKDDCFFMFAKYYIPEERTFSEEHVHYAGWVHEGWIEATPGARIDIEAIQESIKQDAKDFSLAGSENGSGEVCNDPWNAQQLITNLTGEGVACVEVPQTVAMLSEPMKEIEALVKSGKFKHDGNPVTTWMIANVCCRVDKKDNIFPFKEGEENKIDGPVALITAMARAMYTQTDGSSVYKNRGILVF
jgi:phage terminase large subunit-like protein